MSLTSSNKSRLEKEAGWTMIIALYCTEDGEDGNIGHNDPDVDVECGSSVAGDESTLGGKTPPTPLPLEVDIRSRGGGRFRLLKREHTPNKLTPDCRHSSTVTSSTPSSSCFASLKTRSMSKKGRKQDGLL
jgi:hypothetical protein